MAIEVVEDPKSGYNALITIDGMTLSAANVNGDHVDGEGHLHLYVNGQKVGRLYGDATHIPVLPVGEVEITVGAFANDHSAYVIDGEPIEGRPRSWLPHEPQAPSRRAALVAFWLRAAAATVVLCRPRTRSSSSSATRVVSSAVFVASPSISVRR